MIPSLRPSLLVNVAGAPDSAIYVNSAAMDNTTSPTLTSLGAQTGDLAVVSGVNGRDPSSGSGGTWSTADTTSKYRVLTSGDIPSSVTVTTGGWLLTIYRRAALIVPVSNSGFTKAVGHVGIFAFCNARSSLGSGGGYGASVTSPATFTARNSIGFNTSVINDQSVSDRLYPTNALYTDSTAFTVSGTGPSGNSGIIYELRAF